MQSVPVVEVDIIAPGGNRASFILTFYGVDDISPIHVHKALHKRGFVGYEAAPFIRRKSYTVPTLRRWMK